MNFSFVDFAHYVFEVHFAFLWVFLSTFILIVGVQFINLSRHEKALETTIKLDRGYGYFFIIFAIARYINIVANYYYETGFSDSFEFEIFKRTTYIIGLSAVGLLIYLIERILYHRYGYLTLIPVVVIISALTLPYEIFRTINYAVTPVYIVLVVYLYGYIAKNSSGELHRKALYSLFGFALFYFGMALDSRSMKIAVEGSFFEIPFLFTSPFFMIAGIWLFSQSRLKANENDPWKIVEINQKFIKVAIGPKKPPFAKENIVTIKLGDKLKELIPIRLGRVPRFTVDLGILSLDSFQIYSLLDGKKNLFALAGELNFTYEKVLLRTQELIQLKIVAFEYLTLNELILPYLQPEREAALIKNL